MSDVIEIVDLTQQDVQITVSRLDVYESDATTVEVADLALGVVEVAEGDPTTVEVVDTVVETVEVTGTLVEVEVSSVGEKGQRGEKGETGFVVGAGFEQNFAVPSTLWTVAHNLGFTPCVMTYDSQGRGIRGHVEENSSTHTVVSFSVPVAGRVSLS